MAQRSRVRGDKGFRKVLRQLPAAAQAEMADVMRGIGIEMVDAMKADAPVKTGALRRGIEYKLLAKSLRLRIGLLSLKRKQGDLFYGRIIEFGRKAQVVTVTRKRGTSPYRMRVKAMAPRPYVYKRRPDLRRELQRKLQDYWNNVLTAAAAGASFDD